MSLNELAFQKACDDRDMFQRQLAEVIELKLCESRNLCLKPNKLYKFTVDPSCKLCVQFAKESEL